MFRWQQRYMGLVKHIFGLLVGLHPSQSRAVQQAVLSRSMFLVVLGPKEQVSNPAGYKDLVVVKMSKLDKVSVSMMDADHRVRVEYAAQSRVYDGDSEWDILHGMVVVRYSPTGDSSDMTDATVHTVVFSSVSRSTATLRSCGVGYPSEITVGMLYRLLHAHVVDDRR